MRRISRSLLTAGSVVALVACGGGDDAGSDPEGEPDTESASGSEVDPSQALASAGDAIAAAGSELEEAPGLLDRALLDGFGEVAIAITDSDGEVQGWCVLLAETDEQRSRGLMEVEDLQGYAGMLFVWDADSSSSFYMRNTPMPLSIAWFGADGELVSEADMEPCVDDPGCPLYPPQGSYRFALEVPQGDLAEQGVASGSTLRVGGDCAARASPD
ncbi:MAG: DUF192 domain-containing protein [Acidimicrobiales bacterium]